jgi:purine nucleosidase
MSRTTPLLLLVIVCLLAASGAAFAQPNAERIRVILDTDANNELDDQHAIAYLLFNGDVFDVEAITVNRTRAGGGVDQHLAEAKRVVRLCGLDSQIPVLLGADKSFEEIRGQLDRPDFDGAEAVNFIIERAKAADNRRLVLLPVGKLTNIALALEKDPSIIPKVRVVWLGSNYPKRGEYNKENDVGSLNYILDTEVEFEIATVRYGQPSGTDAVRATLEEVRKIMPGKGPKVSPPVKGRHGGEFSTFGDYSVNLFENIRLHGNPPSRALFDMAAVAIVKNPAWATAVEMPAPILQEKGWTERPDNPRKIVLWENFDRKAIMADFYDRMENYQLARLPRDVSRIQPWPNDRRYWQYKGKPVLLLGGTDQDNLFNHPNIGPNGLEAHLDLLVSVGGNYVRNTMSSRDRIDADSDLYNDINRYPFHRDPQSGLYNLDRWDEIYWKQFGDFLNMTARRDIIVQIEIWDRWDYGEVWGGAYKAEAWSAHPFNPKNNINYTAEETNLHHERWQGYPIFRTIPELDNVPKVLAYQEAFVGKLLSISLNHDHILYCISNESTASEQWSRHWARFVRDRARQAGVNIEVTEMWNAHDLTDPMHRRTFDHSDLYSFVDTSQNNLRDGQTHWNNMQAARRMVAEPPRPMNNIKIYGGSALGGGTTEGVNKFWRNIIGGLATSRFHRPGPRDGFFSVGLNALAQTQIRSARLFTQSFDVFRATPDADSRLLLDRQTNEAYLSSIPGRQYAVYFIDGGAVRLDLSDVQGELTLNWLDISNTSWSGEKLLQGGRPVEIKAPGKGQWVALVKSSK